jgi:hypothetical protein
LVGVFWKRHKRQYLCADSKNTATLVVPTVCIYEEFKPLLAQRGEGSTLRAVGVMSLGIMVDLTREIAVNATTISVEFKIAMVDSIISCHCT